MRDFILSYVQSVSKCLPRSTLKKITSEMAIHKCLLLGDGGTGKTSLMKRLVTGEFLRTYEATVSHEIYHLKFNTTDHLGTFDLQVWDISGQYVSLHLFREVFMDVKCAIIMFDVTSRITCKNILYWYRDLIKECGDNISVVVCGNKVDVPHRKVKLGFINLTLSNMKNVQYYDISVKTTYNIEKPILWLAQKLLCNPKLKFTAIPAPAPPLEPRKIRRGIINDLKKRTRRAAKVSLPVDDDLEPIVKKEFTTGTNSPPDEELSAVIPSSTNTKEYSPSNKLNRKLARNKQNK